MPENGRTYEAATLNLRAMRLIAAPDPKDDLSDAELEKMCQDKGRSSDMIRYLIEFVKKL